MRIVGISNVWHVGTLNPADRGANSGSGSYEGNALSVSRCPDAWGRIARLGAGSPHEMTRDGGRFLDVTDLASDAASRDELVAWGVGAGLAVVKPGFRFWTWDEDLEDWTSAVVETLDEALGELEVEEDEVDELDAPEGRRAVETCDRIMPTKALTAMTGMSGAGLGFDALAMAFAMTELPARGERVDGLWWFEDYDPETLSAPRGCILPSEVGKWSAEACDWGDVPDDEELLDDEAATTSTLLPR